MDRMRKWYKDRGAGGVNKRRDVWMVMLLRDHNQAAARQAQHPNASSLSDDYHSNASSS